MQKVEITLSFEAERLEALEYHLKKERTSVKRQLDEALRKLYEEKVPEPLREYIDSKAAPDRPRRPPRGVSSKTAVQERRRSDIAEGGDQHAGNGV